MRITFKFLSGYVSIWLFVVYLSWMITELEKSKKMPKFIRNYMPTKGKGSKTVKLNQSNSKIKLFGANFMQIGK